MNESTDPSEKELTFPQVGMTFGTGKFKWKVERAIYSGPFSDVFVLTDMNNKRKKYAMKCERVVGIVRPVLKLDAMVLPLMNGRRGFPEYITSGRTSTFKYLVMQLLGPDIGKLRKVMSCGRFSLHTAINVGLQSLTLLEELHGAGWLCRDVKAPNLATGLGAESGTIFMLDFGFARRFMTNDNKERRPPRASAALMGTMPYASIAAHCMREQCPKDDIESWFYMLIELMTGKLPWKELPHKTILEYKQHIRNAGYREFFSTLPPQFKDVMRSIDTCDFYVQPDYELIRYLILAAAEHLGANLDKPMDWVADRLLYERASKLGDDVSEVPCDNEKTDRDANLESHNIKILGAVA